MGRGRPRKPAALKDLEGDRGKGRRPYVPDLPLQGTPECPDHLDSVAAEHFTFIAAEFGGVGVLKRVDGPALARLADLWSKYWRASEAYDSDPNEDTLKHVIQLGGAWDRAASKLGIQVVDRAKIVVSQPGQLDPVEETYLRTVG